MSASTVPAAKQAILDLLIARAALNEVGITWGEPTEQEDLLDELVFFHGPVVRLPEWRVLRGPESQAPIDEEYTLTLVVRNRTFGDDRAATEARCWVLVDEVEQGVRADLRLGDVLRTPIVFGEQEVQSHALSDGWYGEATVPLTCSARI